VQPDPPPMGECPHVNGPCQHARRQRGFQSAGWARALDKPRSSINRAPDLHMCAGSLFGPCRQDAEAARRLGWDLRLELQRKGPDCLRARIRFALAHTLVAFEPSLRDAKAEPPWGGSRLAGNDPASRRLASLECLRRPLLSAQKRPSSVRLRRSRRQQLILSRLQTRRLCAIIHTITLDLAIHAADL